MSFRPSVPTPAADGPTCAFCGRRAALSQQHIVPRQLHRDILDESPSYTFRQFGITLAEDEQSYRRIPVTGRNVDRPLQNVTSRTVCAPCNNGWMNQIEQAAVTPLRRLIASRRDQPSAPVSAADCFDLARFAVLSSWCLELNSPVEDLGGTRTPTVMRHAFRRSGDLPGGATVWIGRCVDESLRQWQAFATIGSEPLSNVLLTVHTLAGLAFFVVTTDFETVQPFPMQAGWRRVWPVPPQQLALPDIGVGEAEMQAVFDVRRYARVLGVPVLPG